MNRLHVLVIALLVLAIASVTMNVLLVTGHILGEKSKEHVIKSPLTSAQEQAP